MAPASVAFKVDIDGTPCIVFDLTAAKAKWVAVKAYREAGYSRRGVWPQMSIKRAPEYDAAASWSNFGRALTPESLAFVMAVRP